MKVEKLMTLDKKKIGVIIITALIIIGLFVRIKLHQSINTNNPKSIRSLRVHVFGNQLINQDGNAIRLIGVNRIAGYCIKPPPEQSDIYGPTDSADVAAMAKWNINVVRLTLNEDCWLGINNAPTKYSGSNYQSAIINFIKLIHTYGMYAIIDLHTNAPGTNLSASQQVMADQNHAVAFWTSVANTFKNDPAVIFEPYNEPQITTSNALTTNPWQCWRDGCTITQFTPYEKASPISLQWQSAGMQTLVNAIRATGAKNVITLSGLHFSSDLSQILQYLPIDTQKQLAVTFHNYGTNATQNSGCGPNCWNSIIALIAKQLPVITDEMGEPNCQTNYVTQYMNWADQHNISYLPWVWTNWTCQKYAYGLLADWNGSPNSYGKTFYDHFRLINHNAIAMHLTSVSPMLTKQLNSQNRHYQVELKQNILYGSQPNEILDECIPIGAGGIRPGIINIHGGGFIAGDKKDQDSLCKVLASYGYIVFNINYRLAPTYQWPDQLGDAQLAMRYMKAHASETNLDINRICSYGDSAGGTLAILLDELTVIHSSDVANILSAESPKATCVVDQFGPTDFVKLYNENQNVARNNILPLLNYQTPTSNIALYQDASAITHITASTGPALIIQGTYDATVLPEQSIELENKLQTAGIPTQLITYEGGHEYQGISIERITNIRSRIISFLSSVLQP